MPFHPLQPRNGSHSPGGSGGLGAPDECFWRENQEGVDGVYSYRVPRAIARSNSSSINWLFFWLSSRKVVRIIDFRLS